nr:hypothetical protein [Klebsiella pneumoniae]
MLQRRGKSKTEGLSWLKVSLVYDRKHLNGCELCGIRFATRTVWQGAQALSCRVYKKAPPANGRASAIHDV